MALLQSGKNNLSDPDKPSTSWPDSKLRESPDDRHKRKYPRLYDRGAARGVHFEKVSVGEEARVRRDLPAPRLQHDPTGVGAIDLKSFPMIGDITARSRALKDRQRARKIAIFGQIQPVRLGKGPTGLQVAQSTRIVPDTPSQRRGAIRDRRDPRERGNIAANYMAPASVLNEFANSRLRGLGSTKPVPTSDE